MDKWFEEITYRSMVEISINTLKFCLLSNGGAAIALMTLVGAKGEIFDLTQVGYVMGLFLSGVVLGGFAHVFAYITQLRLHQESLGITTNIKHYIWLNFAIAFVVLSICMFAIGSYWAIQSMAN